MTVNEIELLIQKRKKHILFVAETEWLISKLTISCPFFVARKRKKDNKSI